MRMSRITCDPDAQRINEQASAVRTALRIGRQLEELLATRFHGDRRALTLWIRQYLDVSPTTANRWLALAEDADQVPEHALRLCDVYRLLGFDGQPSEITAE